MPQVNSLEIQISRKREEHAEAMQASVSPGLGSASESGPPDATSRRSAATTSAVVNLKMLRAAYAIRLASAWIDRIIHGRMQSALHMMRLKYTKISQTKESFKMFNAQIATIRKQSQERLEKAVAEAEAAVTVQYEHQLSDALQSKQEARLTAKIHNEQAEKSITNIAIAQRRHSLVQFKLFLSRFQKREIFSLLHQFRLNTKHGTMEQTLTVERENILDYANAILSLQTASRKGAFRILRMVLYRPEQAKMADCLHAMSQQYCLYVSRERRQSIREAEDYKR